MLVLPISHLEAKHFALAIAANADHGQNRHFTALTLVDHREGGTIGKGVFLARSQFTALPLLILGLQGMKDARDA